MPYRFEWDSHKAAINIAKHGVSFDEASTVFDDTSAVIFDDETHSTSELRELKTAINPEPEQDATDDLSPEYSFDYHKARPNRFAGRIDKSQVVVVLDPDISEVFTTPESVNSVLRALITTMPTTPTKPGRRPSPDSGRKPAFR